MMRIWISPSLRASFLACFFLFFCEAGVEGPVTCYLVTNVHSQGDVESHLLLPSQIFFLSCFYPGEVSALFSEHASES